MPYLVTETVATSGGAKHARGHVVSDARAAEIRAEHPQAVTQLTHDDDLCGAMADGACAHESHPWSAPSAPEHAPEPEHDHSESGG